MPLDDAVANVVMNGRILAVQSNGQKRVAQETARALGLRIIMPPAGIVSGVKAHLWEQTGLPAQLHGAPLWSPSTSAPVFYRNQVITVHDLAFVDVPQYFSRSFTLLYRTIVRFAVHSARHLVAVSEFSRQRIIDEYGVRPERISRIYPGVSAAYYPRPAAEQAAIRRELGIGDGPYLVAMALNDARKNLPAILAAWRALGAKRRGARLVLFGRAANPRVFGQSSADTGLPSDDIVAAGPITDDQAAALLSGAHGFVFPSLYEGFGLPIVEAAACGTPVLTSTLASMPEIAPPASLLVDPTSTGEIAEAMATMVAADPTPEQRQQLAQTAATYSWTTAAGQYRAVFDEAFS